jgi:hypothetical protein
MPLAAVSPAEAPTGAPPAPSRPPAAISAGSQGPASVSSSGALLSRLQRLAAQDPTKLAAIATDASQALRSAAASATGDTARGLNQLADGFARTASTGDVSNLHLESPARGRHHHSSGAAKLYAGGSSLVPQTAAAKLEAVSLQVDQALGLNPPPLGPWGNE